MPPTPCGLAQRTAKARPFLDTPRSQTIWRGRSAAASVFPRSGNRSGLSNNGMQLTKAARCAPFALRSWGQSLRAAFAADPECSTDVDEPTATAVGTSKRISDFVGCTGILGRSTPSNPRGSYGGILAAAPGAQVGTAGTPWSGSIGPGVAWLGRKHPEEEIEPLGTTSAPSNKGLERTRRVGVPASRAVVRVSPCRSTRCSTGFGAPHLYDGRI